MRARLRAAVALTVTTQPAANGPVTLDVEQFDPLDGWQFVRALHARARRQRDAALRAADGRALARAREVRRDAVDGPQ